MHRAAACAAALLALGLHAQEQPAAGSGGAQPIAARRFAGPPSATDQAWSEADVAIIRRLRRALLADAATAPVAGTITIATRDGIVALSGFVADADERHRIVDLASAVAGVRRVDDRLTGSGSTARRD